MAALEPVADRESKEPAGKDVAQTVFDGAYEGGVILRVSGNKVILSPPPVITGGDVSTILGALDSALAAAR